VADDVTVISLGHPSPKERRERAAWELERRKVKLNGDVTVTVHVTVKNERFMTAPLGVIEDVEAVVRAALQTGVVESRNRLVGYTFHRPVIDGIDCLMVSFRPVEDRRLMMT
jgi:hypothetical protein